MKKILYISLLAFGLLNYSCKPNLEGFQPSAGDADFSSYVAIGNSLTSGYADGALIYSGQANSYPVMLAEQFAKAGGGTFRVPYLPQVGNGNDGGGNNRRVLGYSTNCLGVTGLGPVYASGVATQLSNVASGGPYNLIGVPGASSFHALAGLYSLGNPFLARFAQTPGISTMLSEALRVNPTFYTLWLGNNDVLGYATGGGVGAVAPASPNPFGGDLIMPAMLQGSLSIIMDSMSKRGAKGAIANIPDVTSIPYFTTVPYNAVVISQGMADTLNGLYTQQGLSHIVWKAGANPFIIVDSNATTHPVLRIRQATAEDLIVLTVPMDSVRCAQWGINPLKPLADNYVLDKDEVYLCQTYTQQYNSIIASLASTYKVALVDMNSYMKTFKTGLVYNGVTMSAAFISGGAFSLDGVHPNPRGYALIANEFIRTINTYYNAYLPETDVTKYNGIIFPN